MNNFQTILVAIFLAFFVFGVLIFSGFIKFDSKKNTTGVTGDLVIWGAMPSSQISELLYNNLPGAGDTYNLKYVEQDINKFQQNLIEAYAKDKGPDLFILPSDMVLENSDFIYKIPYESYSQKAFESSFIDGASIYLSKEGILGFPLLVDPLVLYYNKNILSNESMLFPVASWDELFGLSSKLTKKNKEGAITQSMIALGQYDNVNHSKDILSMLLLQSNNSVITQSDTGYRFTVADSSRGIAPFGQIINFFLEFSNPSNDSYSWNRSLPNSLDMFTAGKLAFYIGYSSELFEIESKNPNLSYNVSTIPQTKGTDLKRTYGNMHSVFISKKSKNLNGALIVASMMTDKAFLKELGTAVSLPSASRALLADKPKDPYLSTFYDSAIISRSWLDPSDASTDLIFKELIENSLSNKLSVEDAIGKASSQLDLILKKLYE